MSVETADPWQQRISWRARCPICRSRRIRLTALEVENRGTKRERLWARAHCARCGLDPAWRLRTVPARIRKLAEGKH